MALSNIAYCTGVVMCSVCVNVYALLQAGTRNVEKSRGTNIPRYKWSSAERQSLLQRRSSSLGLSAVRESQRQAFLKAKISDKLAPFYE